MVGLRGGQGTGENVVLLEQSLGILHCISADFGHQAFVMYLEGPLLSLLEDRFESLPFIEPVTGNCMIFSRVPSVKSTDSQNTCLGVAQHIQNFHASLHHPWNRSERSHIGDAAKCPG